MVVSCCMYCIENCADRASEKIGGYDIISPSMCNFRAYEVLRKQE